jgi:hypothetical protein
MENKKQFCDRCKRELDWEFKEMLNESTKEYLVRMILGLQQELLDNQVKGGKKT